MAARRGARFWLGYGAGCAAFGLLALEILVRLFVPASRFYSAGDLYRASDDPEIGYTLKPNLDTIAFGVPLRTNSLGFRGREWARAKPPGTFRIAFVGDSHAFGYGVPWDDTLAARIERALDGAGGRRVEVLDFGVPGYNSKQERAVFRKVALDFAPDVIVIVPCNNDAQPALTVDDQGYLLSTAHETIEKRRLRDQSFEPLRGRAAGWLTRHSRLVLYVRLALERRRLASAAQERHAARVVDRRYPWMVTPLVPGPWPDAWNEPVFQPLDDIVREAKERRIGVVLAPYESVGEWRQLFTAVARKHDVPLLELLALLPDVKSWPEAVDRYGLGWDTGHLNASAQALWAAALAPLVRERYLGLTSATRAVMNGEGTARAP